jgi:hypothetical protein
VGLTATPNSKALDLAAISNLRALNVSLTVRSCHESVKIKYKKINIKE